MSSLHRRLSDWLRNSGGEKRRQFDLTFIRVLIIRATVCAFLNRGHSANHSRASNWSFAARELWKPRRSALSVSFFFGAAAAGFSFHWEEFSTRKRFIRPQEGLYQYQHSWRVHHRLPSLTLTKSHPQHRFFYCSAEGRTSIGPKVYHKKKKWIFRENYFPNLIKKNTWHTYIKDSRTFWFKKKSMQAKSTQALSGEQKRQGQTRLAERDANMLSRNRKFLSLHLNKKKKNLPH